MLLYKYLLLKTVSHIYIYFMLYCLIITPLPNGRKIRLVGALGNHVFTCPNHVPSPENERQLSTGLGLITQANKSKTEVTIYSV